MYTLFGFKGSGSASVECALEMTGAPYRIVDAASWEDNDALAELERVNPLRQIPTLQLPGGAVLSESAAILVHLGLASACTATGTSSRTCTRSRRGGSSGATGPARSTCSPPRSRAGAVRAGT